MIRTVIAASALTLVTVFQATPAAAQQRWSVELRGSGQVSTQDAARENHENGYGLEASVQYRVLEHVSAYAGWAYTHFAALEAIAGPDMDLEETGYVLGLRFEHPIRDGAPTRYWVRTGATYDHLELENADGDIVEDSGHGLGWEVGAGLAFPIRDRWSVTPGIRYRSLSRDLDIGAATTTVDLEYVGFEIGIRRAF